MKVVGENFRKNLSEQTRINDSRLILALDVSEENTKEKNLEQTCLDIVENTSDSLAAIKIGIPLVLNLGLEIISTISKKTPNPIIADFKIADIPYISKKIAQKAFKTGADAVITHGFTGKDCLETIIKTAQEENNKGVFVVSNMSHPGGETFIKPASDQILKIAKETNATGIIGPATRPEDVVDLRGRAGEDLLILTPGVGAQGARAGVAVRSGADYEIVGRAIYTSDSPGESADRIREEINETLSEG